MTTLYFDCFSGASGDMILGALIDAGVPLDDVRRALGSLAIDRDTVWTEHVTRAGITATRFCVRGQETAFERAHDDEHGHVHAHEARRPAHGPAQALETVHHHVHRTLAEIHALIDGSSLSRAGKNRARELFARLAETEAAIHGMPVERVHLHEVGALDSIIDIVGAVHALATLKPGRIVASPLNVGSGSVRSSHGLYPVPAPATIRLLRDAPIYAGPQDAELVTPTGALLVTSYASDYGPVPPMRLKAVGYGAGTRDFHDAPNVLRVLIGEAESAARTQSVVVVEAEIDDMNPQIFGVLMDRLLAEGALDVFYTPIQMKKNRPGTLLTLISAPEARERLTATIFRETTTIGVRYREMTRECLERETVTIATPLGDVRFKIARRNGEMLNASPEFDDCARIARERDVPVKDVQAAAMKAFLDSSRPQP
ncbi:MAG TPA: nickel pincer cofactor biosynthesis protein LarC [Vicinamibacterales bacterium]